MDPFEYATRRTAIFIPSRDRGLLLPLRKKHTLTYTQHANSTVYLVVRMSERYAYSDLAQQFNATLVPVPDDIDRLAETYDWITDNFCVYEKALFLDDDLIFSTRPNFNTSGLQALEPEDFPLLEEQLFGLVNGSTAMAGIAHRRGAQNYTEPLRFSAKLIAVLCCNLTVIREQGIRWAWGYDSMFDHNMNLELLSRGFTNVMCTAFTHDDIFTRFKDGGCTAYRDIDVHSKAAEALANKFPDVVSLREKLYEGQGKFGWDVTMRMKKAFGG